MPGPKPVHILSKDDKVPADNDQAFAFIIFMPRAKAILQSQFPYNISARCINREWFRLPMEKVWTIFCEELAATTKDHQWTIHSFVLMSNHFHMIVTTPNANISTCMQQFMYRVSRRLTKAGNRINQTFAGRHYKCILQEHNYYLNAYKYNYRNPVAAGLCQRVEDYPYSTLQALLEKTPSLIPLADDLTLKNDILGTLQWLNHEPPPKLLEGVRHALKHQYFKSKKDKITNRPILGLDDIM